MTVERVGTYPIMHHALAPEQAHANNRLQSTHTWIWPKTTQTGEFLILELKVHTPASLALPGMHAVPLQRLVRV